MTWDRSGRDQLERLLVVDRAGRALAALLVTESRLPGPRANLELTAQQIRMPVVS